MKNGGSAPEGGRGMRNWEFGIQGGGLLRFFMRVPMEAGRGEVVYFEENLICRAFQFAGFSFVMEGKPGLWGMFKI